VYISEAEKYDKALVESWRSDMDGLLIFVRTSLVIISRFQFKYNAGWSFFWKSDGFPNRKLQESHPRVPQHDCSTPPCPDFAPTCARLERNYAHYRGLGRLYPYDLSIDL
jgi:hypothetical protein